ncbi:MAG: hypothetical protein RJB39_472 [Candidatus Parcubacteria bacterium]|jgi:hypothetical protein
MKHLALFIIVFFTLLTNPNLSAKDPGDILLERPGQELQPDLPLPQEFPPQLEPQTEGDDMSLAPRAQPSFPQTGPGNNVRQITEDTIDGVTYGDKEKGQLVNYSLSGKGHDIEAIHARIDECIRTKVPYMDWQVHFDSLATEQSSVEIVWKLHGEYSDIKKTVKSKITSWLWMPAFGQEDHPLNLVIVIEEGGVGQVHFFDDQDRRVGMCRFSTSASPEKWLPEGMRPVLAKADQTHDGKPAHYSKEAKCWMYFPFLLDEERGKYAHGGNNGGVHGSDGRGCIRLPKVVEALAYASVQVGKSQVEVRYAKSKSPKDKE